MRSILDKKINRNASKIFSRMVNYLIYAIGIYLILNQVLGLNLSSLLAAAGIVTIIIGLSTQQLLQNVIAGIIIALERPLKLGDWVEIGGWPQAGISRVRDITLLRVVLRKLDGSIVYIPTSNLLSYNIINYTKGEFIKVAFNIELPATSDIKKAEKIILDVCRRHSDVLPNISNQKRSILKSILEKETIPHIEYVVEHFKKLVDSGKDLSIFAPKVIIKNISGSKIVLEVWIRIIEVDKKDEIVSELLTQILEEFKKERIKLD